MDLCLLADSCFKRPDILRESSDMILVLLDQRSDRVPTQQLCKAIICQRSRVFICICSPCQDNFIIEWLVDDLVDLRLFIREQALILNKLGLVVFEL